MTMQISHTNLMAFLDTVLRSGKKLMAPTAPGGKVRFAPVTGTDAIVFDYVQTVVSPKSLHFPKAERLLSYECGADGLSMTDHAQDPIPETILFGTHPCDAVAIARLTDFFQRDYPDALQKRRREALTIISLSCTRADEYCFCTSTGTGPGDTAGSDILLTPIGNGEYFVEIITAKGSALIDASKDLFRSSPAIDTSEFLAPVEEKWISPDITARLTAAFDHPRWKDASLRCLGCGACAFVCPVCSCFDIQDEGTTRKGQRIRCWDSCGFAQFTLHTSGHNPRPVQSDRWRQRVMHKYSYQPEQFGWTGCTGCGRCSRACPADMNLKEELSTILIQISLPGEKA